MTSAPGRHVALTGDVPAGFGGLTTALLQRSRLLAEHTDLPCEVLTVSHQPGLPDVRRDLADRGLLTDGVRLLNLWEELARLDDEVLAGAGFDPDATPPKDEGHHVDEVRREDGTLLARQWWWTAPHEHAPVAPLGDDVRHTELLDRSGRRLGGWDGQWPLWAFWLDRHLRPDDRVVVDSAWIADFVTAHPLAPPTVWLVHNTHLKQGRARPLAPVERWRSFSFARTEAFDAVAFLSEQQRREVELAFGADTRHVVVPNALDLHVSAPEGPLSRSRPATAGVVVAKLERRKRLEHALRAVTSTAVQHPDLSVRICGDGPQREALEEMARELDAPVEWVGYTRDTPGEYARASFLPLTSRREGLPLVLAEAMAQGCLPVAYDVAYGPADMITHGVDGFLVPEGDVEAFARQLDELVSLPRRRLRAMRNAARRSAGRYGAAAVLPRWTTLFDELVAARPDHASVGPTDLRRLAALERLSVAHRVEQPAVAAQVTDVAWSGTTVTVEVDVDRTGLQDLAGSATVDLALVDPTTGRRAAEVREQLPAGRGSVRLTISLDGLDAEHVLWARYAVGDLVLHGTVASCRPPVHERLGPVAAGRRPVLVEQKDEGVRLVHASPHVLGEALADGTDIVVRVLPPSSPTAVRLRGPAGAVVELEPTEPGTARTTLPPAGSWALQAQVDGRWRDVAWPTDAAAPTTPVRLTARGYVKVDVTA